MANLQSDYQYQLTVKKVGAVNPLGYVSDNITAEPANEASTQFISLAPAAVDTAIPVGGVSTASLVALRADGPGLTLKIGTAVVGAFTSFLLTGAALTAAITVSNPGDQQVNLQVIIVG